MKTSRAPKFSIIIPAHNSASHEFFTKCLESITTQSFKDYELIVVADKCSDNTADVARSFGATVIEVEHGNDGFARNTGIDNANGEWILFLDDDDWWMHDRVLECMISHLADGIDVLQFGFYWKDVGYTLIIDGGIPCNVWSKAWRRSYIGDTRVKEKVYPAADKALTDAVFAARAPVVALWDSPIYFYNYMRAGSITETEARK